MMLWRLSKLGESKKYVPIGGDPYKTLELRLECASQLSGLCDQLILTVERCALPTCKHSTGYDDWARLGMTGYRGLV